MEEDHHHYTNMSDLRQLINGGRPPPPHFPTPSLFAASHRNLPFDMMMAGARPAADLRLPLHDFVTTDHHSHTTATTSTSTAPVASASASGTVSATTHFGGGLEADAGGGGDGATGRWPRQETLTLLDIRSRLDPKFKEANHKGPLWDEISRIMCEEHGYQRSGKKCREKFENLYKYYKKTKEGKAGRQDGKHYRFFRQLEALYGDTASISMINPVSFHGQEDISLKGSHKLCDSLSLSNSSEVDTSEEEDDNGESKRRKRGKGWKAKIKDFIDTQMRKLMEKQDAWLEKMMRTMEHKEHERAVREEKWRSEEAARVDRERKLWAKERAWIESRDAALIEIMEKIKGREGTFKGSSTEELNNENGSEIETLNDTKGVDQDLGGSGFNNNNNWSEPEITRLIQLRSSLESRLNNSHNNINEELLREEIGAKMSCYGYERSGSMCKEKWDAINYYLIKKTKEECNKKRKDNSTSYNFHNNNNNDHATNSLYNNQGQGGGYSEIINEQGSETARLQPKNEGSSPSSSNAGNVVQDSCFRFLMGDNGDQQHGLWESYGLKLNNGGNQ